MAASYELSKRDGRVGGPERPLSTAGAASYAVYWGRAVGKLLLQSKANRAVNVGDISAGTGVLEEDVLGTLLAMGLGSEGSKQGKDKGKRKDGSVVVDKVMVRKWLADKGIDVEREVIDSEAFVEWEVEDEEEE